MKAFLIIGNQNAISYKEIFPLIKGNRVRLGINNGAKEYLKPDGTRQKMGNTGWFTNLEHNHRHEPLILTRHYTPDAYPKYDNYDAINVDKTSDIPCDYDGVMGVPITFLDKYCPEQFEIVGIDGGDMGVSYGVGATLSKAECDARFKEHNGFRRGNLCYRNNEGKLNMCYARILIRRRK